MGAVESSALGELPQNDGPPWVPGILAQKLTRSDALFDALKTARKNVSKIANGFILNALFKPNFEDLDHINLLDAVRSTIAEQKAKLSIAETNFLVEKLIAPCSWSKGDENRFFEAYPSYSHLRNINVEYSSCAILFTQVRVLNRLFFHEMDVNLIHIPTLPKLILALLDISDDETQTELLDFLRYCVGTTPPAGQFFVKPCACPDQDAMIPILESILFVLHRGAALSSEQDEWASLFVDVFSKSIISELDWAPIGYLIASLPLEFIDAVISQCYTESNVSRAVLSAYVCIGDTATKKKAIDKLFGQEISLPWACVKPLDNFLLDARVFLPVVESALAMTDHSQLSSCATFGYVLFSQFEAARGPILQAILSYLIPTAGQSNTANSRDTAAYRLCLRKISSLDADEVANVWTDDVVMILRDQIMHGLRRGSEAALDVLLVVLPLLAHSRLLHSSIIINIILCFANNSATDKALLAQSLCFTQAFELDNDIYPPSSINYGDAYSVALEMLHRVNNGRAIEAICHLMQSFQALEGSFENEQLIAAVSEICSNLSSLIRELLDSWIYNRAELKQTTREPHLLRLVFRIVQSIHGPEIDDLRMQLKKLVKSSTAEFGLIIILAAGSCARSKEMLDTLGLEFIESKLATANTSLSSSYDIISALTFLIQMWEHKREATPIGSFFTSTYAKSILKLSNVITKLWAQNHSYAEVELIGITHMLPETLRMLHAATMARTETSSASSVQIPMIPTLSFIHDVLRLMHMCLDSCLVATSDHLHLSAIQTNLNAMLDVCEADLSEAPESLVDAQTFSNASNGVSKRRKLSNLRSQVSGDLELFDLSPNGQAAENVIQIHDVIPDSHDINSGTSTTASVFARLTFYLTRLIVEREFIIGLTQKNFVAYLGCINAAAEASKFLDSRNGERDSAIKTSCNSLLGLLTQNRLDHPSVLGQAVQLILAHHPSQEIQLKVCRAIIMNVVTSTSDVNHHSDLDMDEEAWNVRLIGSFSATTIPKPLLAAFEKLYSLLEPNCSGAILERCLRSVNDILVWDPSLPIHADLFTGAVLARFVGIMQRLATRLLTCSKRQLYVFTQLIQLVNTFGGQGRLFSTSSLSTITAMGTLFYDCSLLHTRAIAVMDTMDVEEESDSSTGDAFLSRPRKGANRHDSNSISVDSNLELSIEISSEYDEEEENDEDHIEQVVAKAYPQTNDATGKKPDNRRYNTSNAFISAAMKYERKPDDYSDLEDWIVCKKGKSYL